MKFIVLLLFLLTMVGCADYQYVAYEKAQEAYYTALAKPIGTMTSPDGKILVTIGRQHIPPPIAPPEPWYKKPLITLIKGTAFVFGIHEGGEVISALAAGSTSYEVGGDYTSNIGNGSAGTSKPVFVEAATGE